MINMPSSNFDDRGGRIPCIIVLHYTGMKNAKEALERLTDQQSKVSSHYTIDEDGTLYQHVSEDKRAWHAGQSCWQGETDINALSIGIEIVNPGHEFGYKEFPDLQIESLKKLCFDIQQRHAIKYVLGHSDVAPTRKLDPGELFPWEELAREGIGIWPKEGGHEHVYDIYEMLTKIGYDICDKEKALIAFQRHYVPEAFGGKSADEIKALTLARASALISNS